MNRNWTPGSDSRGGGRKARTTKLSNSLPWDDHGEDEDDDFDMDFDLDKELAKIKNEDVHQPMEQQKQQQPRRAKAVAPVATTNTSKGRSVSPKSLQKGKGEGEGSLRSLSRSPLGMTGSRESALAEVDKMLQDDLSLRSTAPMKSSKATKSTPGRSRSSERGLVGSGVATNVEEEESVEMKSSTTDSGAFDNDSESSDDLLKDSFNEDEKKQKASSQSSVVATVVNRAVKAGKGSKTESYTPSPRKTTKKRVFKFPSKAAARRPLRDPFAKIGDETDSFTDERHNVVQVRSTSTKSPVSKGFEERSVSLATKTQVPRIDTATADKVVQLEGQNQQLEGLNQSYQAQLAALQFAKDELNEELDGVKLECSRSQESVQQQSLRIHKLEGEKRLLEERLAVTQKDLAQATGSLDALQKEYKEKHSSLLKERESLNSLRNLGEGFDKSARLLEDISMKFKERFESSEHARSVQLEAREKLVAEMERGAREHRDKALQESSRLQAIVDSLEASNRLVHVRHEEERCRLREEHNRLDALKLTLTTEAEIIRNDVAEQRIRLRDEKEQWEPYKREQESKIALQLEEVRSLWRRYYKEQAEFDLERKNYSQEKEAFASRVQEEELHLARAKEKMLLARRSTEDATRTLDHEKHQLSIAASSFEGEREALVKERQQLEDAALAVKRREEEVGRKLAQITTEKVAAEQALQESTLLKADIASERNSLEAKLQEVILGQRRYRELRLSVVQQHHTLHAEKAAVSKLASDSRRLQSTLLQQLVCPQQCASVDKSSAAQAMVDSALKSTPLLTKATNKARRSAGYKLNENQRYHNITRGLDSESKKKHNSGGREDIVHTLRQIDQDFDSFTSS